MIFKDNYEWISGWIHDYYCDKDGSELIFDLNNSQYFECPTCNYKYTDEKKKRAWITKYRYKIFKSLEDYSKKFLENKDEELIKYITEALTYYSLNYNKFAIHDKKGQIFNAVIKASNRCGRITAQGLNEAMISIQIVNCLNNIGIYLDSNTKKNVYKELFPKIYALLQPQITKIHNIDCYEICSIAMMGIISNNQKMLEFAFCSPSSFYNQLDKGLTKDYFWFEGSFHYHFFVLKPILELLKLAKKYKFNIPMKYYNIAKKMLIQGYRLSFSDCSLPSPNDGWPNRNLKDYFELFKLGNQIFNEDCNNILKSINHGKNEFETIHCSNTGFSMIKNENLDVFIKYQDNNFNHAHPDKLNIEIKYKNEFLTHDLSTSGYGSKINEFYKKTYSHNTVVIDGKNHNQECSSIINSYSNTSLDVMVENIYDNVNIARKIKLLSKEIEDKVIVHYCGNKNIDYLFHCDAKLISKLIMIKKESFFEYPYLMDVKEVITPLKKIVLKWKISKKTVISIINIKNMKLFICSSPDNPDKRKRTTILIRSHNINNPVFTIVWKFIG